MLNKIKNFTNDESGAVTVDWVVLTGGVVILGFIVLAIIRPSALIGAGNIAVELETPINP